jgi:Small subunit of acetolactate synthase
MLCNHFDPCDVRRVYHPGLGLTAEQTVTLSVTGDAGKVMALQLKLGKFGIVELVRTGKIALKRGRQLLEMGGWGDSALRRRQQQRQKQVRASWMCKLWVPTVHESDQSCQVLQLGQRASNQSLLHMCRRQMCPARQHMQTEWQTRARAMCTW